MSRITSPGTTGSRGVIIDTTTIETVTIETKTMMRPRAIVEILIVLGIVGLLLEIAEGHTWIVIGAGVAAAIWLMARSH
jgi:arginine exporter protein ArgO